MKTKIICTIGPSSEKPAILKKLISEGMDIARINFSHGNYDQYHKIIKNVRNISKETKKKVSILCDLQGSKIRISDFKRYPKKIVDGAEIILMSNNCKDKSKKVISIESPNIHKKVKKGQIILIDDGKIELIVEKISDCKIYAKIIRGGDLYPNKGLNLPHNAHVFKSITEKDKKDLDFINKINPEFIALSFVKDANDIMHLKKYIKNNKTKIVSKIENALAIKNLDEIIKISDAIMVARGDLGIEIPIERMPIIQKRIINKCNNANTFVITATHMLDSMTRVPYPTRAEATDVANAIIDGTDAVLLSNETAVGLYPAEALMVLRRIVKETEKYTYKKVFSN